jgi:TPR repeat protein
MISRHVRSLGVVASCAYCLAGGVYKQSDLPREQVALLTNPGETHVSITRIDGETKSVPAHGTYEFRPGKHAIRIDYHYQTGRTSWSGQTVLDCFFYAEAGARLKAVCEESHADQQNGTWRFWIEDSATGRPVVMTRYDVARMPDPSRQEEPSASIVDLYGLAVGGKAEAQYFLGYCYETGRGVTVDYRESLRWYRQAAAQGFAKAEAAIGVDYLEARGVDPDAAEGARWLRLAADRNEAEAQLRLGDCYAAGKGVAKEPVQAAQWYRKASAGRSAEAQSRLAKCYATGTGVEKDLVMAYAWYMVADANGEPTASIELNALELDGLGPEQIARAKAQVQTLGDVFKPKAARP